MALPSDTIVHLQPPQWTRPVLTQVIKMPPHWLALGTSQCVCSSTVVSPTVAWRNLQKYKDKKRTQNNIPKDLFEKHMRDPSQEVKPPKSEFQKKINLQTPFTKLLPIHPANLDLSLKDYSSIGKLHSQMYARDQGTAYPPGLNISKAINIKIITGKVCCRILIWDVIEKKGFTQQYNENMPWGQMKVEVVNYSWNLRSLFNGKELVHSPNTYDTKTFWSKIV